MNPSDLSLNFCSNSVTIHIVGYSFVIGLKYLTAEIGHIGLSMGWDVSWINYHSLIMMSSIQLLRYFGNNIRHYS